MRRVREVYTGIYIMQNTMVRGGGWPAGEKMKLGVRGEKWKKGKKNGRKLHKKTGKKTLKCIFLVQQKF